MLHSGSFGKKNLKLYLIAVIFISSTILLLVSDIFVDKIHFSPRFTNSCILCPIKSNRTFVNNTEPLYFVVNFSGNAQSSAINIMLFFTHADHKPELKNKLALCISSMFKYATLHLHFHILTDNISLNSAMDVLKESAVLARTSAEVSFYDVNAFVEPLQELINTIRPLFSFKQGAYYSDGLFFISVGLFKIMLLKKLIIVDADVKFLDDIKELHDYFNKFPPEALIGAASEQQPVYRHVLHEYRRIYNDTLAGGPPPDGKTGFNSGVLLLDLEKMRHSDLYNEIVNNSSFVLYLVEKYKFKGHLGDQDFYSLINLEYPYLFYHLPCTWNRQLCQWWKYHGYKDVFDLYHSCSGKIHLLHGNCNTMIPDK